MTEITVDDALALLAFVEALAKLESPLAEGFIEDINAVGKCLSGDRSKIITRIRSAYKNNPTLDNLYREERKKLRQSYQFGERQKAKPPEDDDRAIVLNVTDNKLIRLAQILEDKNPIEAIKQEKETKGKDWCQMLEIFMK